MKKQLLSILTAGCLMAAMVPAAFAADANDLQAQIDALTERRKGLYEWKRRGMDVTQELSAVNERLRQTRRSLNLCQSIETDIPRLQTQTQQYREQRTEKAPGKRKHKQQER